MKITDFERNAEDKVVAICGEVKHVLSWDFVVQHTPQIGDLIVATEEGIAFVGKEIELAEAAIEEILFPDELPTELPVDPTPVEPEIPPV